MTAVVLLPGMEGSGSLFGPFVTALGLDACIVSYPPDRPLGYDELELFALERLPANEPFILLGESFSGPIAIGLAARRPPNLKALVLVCTFARIAEKRAPGWVHALFALLPFWRLPVPFGAARLFGRFNSPEVHAKLAAAIKDVKPAVWRRRMRAILDVDVTPRLQQIEVPLLYLRATDDKVVPTAASELILRSCSRARIVPIEAPHALLQTRPDAAAAAIREFARETGIAL